MNKKDTIVLLGLASGEKMLGRVESENETTIVLQDPKVLMPISPKDLGLVSPCLIDNGEKEIAEVNKALVNYKVIVNPGSELYNLYIQATTNIKIAPPSPQGESNLKLVPPAN